jgi:hypothetical protein
MEMEKSKGKKERKEETILVCLFPRVAQQQLKLKSQK